MPHQREESTSTDIKDITTTDTETNPIPGTNDSVKRLHLRHPKIFQFLLIGTLLLLSISIFVGVILVHLFPRKVTRSTTNPPPPPTPTPTTTFKSSTIAPQNFTSINETELKQRFLDHINYVRHISNVGGLSLVEWDDRIYERVKARLKTCDTTPSNKIDRQPPFIAKFLMAELLKVWSWNVFEVWCAPWSWYEYGPKNKFPSGCRDKHSNKQCREMAQLLSSNVRVVGCAAQVCPNHPVIAGCFFYAEELEYQLNYTNDTCQYCSDLKCYEGLCATQKQCEEGKLICSDVTPAKIAMQPYSAFNVNKDNIIARVAKNIITPQHCSKG